MEAWPNFRALFNFGPHWLLLLCTGFLVEPPAVLQSTQNLGLKWRSQILNNACAKCFSTQKNFIQKYSFQNAVVPVKLSKDFAIFDADSGFFLSVDRLSLQHLVCRCIVFHRCLLLKIHRKFKARKVDDRVFPRCSTSLQHLALVGSNGFWVFFAWIRENSLEKLIDGKIRSSFPE